MTSIEFNDLVHKLDLYAQQTMNKKGPEYTTGHEDVLNNFKSTAKKLGVDPLVIWYAYFDKQVSSVAAHVSNEDLNKAEPMISGLVILSTMQSLATHYLMKEITYDV